MKLLVILILVLLLILFQGVFWNKFWARELNVDLHFADYGVTEGEDSSLIETITNRKWLPIPVFLYAMAKDPPQPDLPMHQTWILSYFPG